MVGCSEALVLNFAHSSAKPNRSFSGSSKVKNSHNNINSNSNTSINTMANANAAVNNNNNNSASSTNNNINVRNQGSKSAGSHNGSPQVRPAEPQKKGSSGMGSPARKARTDKPAAVQPEYILLKTPSKGDRSQNDTRSRTQSCKPTSSASITASTPTNNSASLSKPKSLESSDVFVKLSGIPESARKRRNNKPKMPFGKQSTGEEEERQEQPQQQQQQKRPIETPVFFPQTSQRRQPSTMPQRQRRLSAPDLRLQQMTAEMAQASPTVTGNPQISPGKGGTLYAGATFQNSPAASALPMPVFTDRGVKSTTSALASSPDSVESSSLPTPSLHAPLFRGPSRTFSHEALNAASSPSTRERHQHHDQEMFAMDDEHKDEDLKQKSRHLLSLLTGTRNGAPTHSHSFPNPTQYEQPHLHSNNNHPNYPHHPIHPHHHVHPYAHDSGGSNGSGGGGGQREFSAPPFTARPMPPRPLSMPGHLPAHHQQQQQPQPAQDENILARISHDLKNMLNISGSHA
ncbi:hypothetical protein DFJ77DRAFT_292726 [Powellomyces hirtus]|nr:hypothetical protein DFJ77DRAFT_292726 [Powellomyces hirtus]